MKYAIKHTDPTIGYVARPGFTYGPWSDFENAWIFDSAASAADNKYEDEFVVSIDDDGKEIERVQEHTPIAEIICPSLDHRAWEWLHRFEAHHHHYSLDTLNSILSSLTSKFAEAQDSLLDSLLVGGYKAGWKAGVEWYRSKVESEERGA